MTLLSTGASKTEGKRDCPWWSCDSAYVCAFMSAARLAYHSPHVSIGLFSINTCKHTIPLADRCDYEHWLASQRELWHERRQQVHVIGACIIVVFHRIFRRDGNNRLADKWQQLVKYGPACFSSVKYVFTVVAPVLPSGCPRENVKTIVAN